MYIVHNTQSYCAILRHNCCSNTQGIHYRHLTSDRFWSGKFKIITMTAFTGHHLHAFNGHTFISTLRQWRAGRGEGQRRKKAILWYVSIISQFFCCCTVLKYSATPTPRLEFHSSLLHLNYYSFSKQLFSCRVRAYAKEMCWMRKGLGILCLLECITSGCSSSLYSILSFVCISI